MASCLFCKDLHFFFWKQFKRELAVNPTNLNTARRVTAHQSSALGASQHRTHTWMHAGSSKLSCLYDNTFTMYPSWSLQQSDYSLYWSDGLVLYVQLFGFVISDSHLVVHGSHLYWHSFHSAGVLSYHVTPTAFATPELWEETATIHSLRTFLISL